MLGLACAGMPRWIESIGGWNFIYFALDIVFTIGIVGLFVKWLENSRWKCARQIYAKDLLSKTNRLAEVYETGLPHLYVCGSESESGQGDTANWYVMNRTAAVRRFEKDVKELRQSIWDSINLGYISITPELSRDISEYQEVVDNLVQATCLLIDIDESLRDIGGNRVTSDTAGHGAEQEGTVQQQFGQGAVVHANEIPSDLKNKINTLEKKWENLTAKATRRNVCGMGEMQTSDPIKKIFILVENFARKVKLSDKDLYEMNEILTHEKLDKLGLKLTDAIYSVTSLTNNN